jgi:acyl dehydratase
VRVRSGTSLSRTILHARRQAINQRNGSNIMDIHVVPAAERYFEDYVVGAVDEFGDISVTQEEIVEFARRYDPQDMHIDPLAAAQGPFGGLIASGWHTAAMVMRLVVSHYLSKIATLPSPGIDELRWVRPVRPDDRLRVRATVVEANRSRSKPDRGIVRSLVEVLNQNDELVMSFRPMNLMRCRNVMDRVRADGRRHGGRG